MIPSTEQSFAQYAILSEPQLEFGQPRSRKAEESDPQKGLEKHGPYSTRLGGKWHPAKTTLVPIAADDDWVEVIQGLNRLRSFQQIEQPTYTARIDFPGFESAFRLEAHHCRAQSSGIAGSASDGIRESVVLAFGGGRLPPRSLHN